ncbi:hypothetical protein ABWH96_16875 [Marivirga tractuosa]|uniref:hypothetical protein n=1 Tax=Marivirga tractuosa TaxID=1006 RepID=UPI0035CF24AC
MAKIHFIPYAKYEIKTDLNIIEIQERIAEEISTQSRVKKLFHDNKKKFRGKVGPHGFKLRKILDHRNSWNPTLKGQFIELEHGTLVKLKVSIHPIILIFSLLFTAFILFLGLANANSLVEALWPILIFFLLYIFTFFGFNLAAEQAVDTIYKTIGGRSH